jgi:hypothetical protein
MAKPVLDLDTLVERAPVRIDGQMYEMLNPAELSILDLHRFGAAGEELASLKRIDSTTEISDEQMQLISATLTRMVRIILRAPAEVQDRLTDVHRFRIVNAFNELTLMPPPAAVVSAEAGPAEPEALPAEPEARVIRPIRSTGVKF